ncbi:hypothetical protein TNCV_21531 [Trichonephila clavipes]|nr:hypothetical protein TNCV_21531 [Trichonephila clavipes]
MHEQVYRSGVRSEARPPVFKLPSKLGTHLSTHCIPGGVLVTDLVILKHGQLRRTTPELEFPSFSIHTTPKRDVGASTYLMCLLCAWRVFSGTSLERMTRRP